MIELEADAVFSSLSLAEMLRETEDKEADGVASLGRSCDLVEEAGDGTRTHDIQLGKLTFYY